MQIYWELTEKSAKYIHHGKPLRRYRDPQLQEGWNVNPDIYLAFYIKLVYLSWSLGGIAQDIHVWRWLKISENKWK